MKKKTQDDTLRKLVRVFLAFLLTINTINFTKVFADTEGTYGSIYNETQIENDKATINKQVAFTNDPGLFDITLTVTGKERTEPKTTDIVIVYDNSNSMYTNNRVGIAKTATEDFITQMLAAGPSIRFAVVTYGSAVFDGRTFNWIVNSPTTTQDFSQKTFTRDTNLLFSSLPSNVPENRNRSNHGGTFTEQALEEAGKVFTANNSTADNKIIVTITDGVPTLSYNNYPSNVGVSGAGNNYIRTGTYSNHGTPTINMGTKLKNDGYTLYSVGVELTGSSNATQDDAEAVLAGIAHPGNDYNTDQVSELTERLKDIRNDIVKSISDGTIIDPIGDMFILQSTPFVLTENSSGLLTTVTTANSTANEVRVEGLNLGDGETVTIKYQVRLNTELPGFQFNTLYKTNKTTYLYPDSDYPTERIKFPEPKASGKPLHIFGNKI